MNQITLLPKLKQHLEMLLKHLVTRVALFLLVIISQYQYEYSFVIDKEICVAAMLNKLLKL